MRSGRSGRRIPELKDLKNILITSLAHPSCPHFLALVEGEVVDLESEDDSVDSEDGSEESEDESEESDGGAESEGGRK